MGGGGRGRPAAHPAGEALRAALHRPKRVLGGAAGEGLREVSGGLCAVHLIALIAYFAIQSIM